MPPNGRESQNVNSPPADAVIDAAAASAGSSSRDSDPTRRLIASRSSWRLVLDRTKITAEARLDGKYLLSTSDPDLSAEDVALGYKNLLEAERGFRDR